MDNKTIYRHLDRIQNFKDLIQSFYDQQFIKKKVYIQTMYTINVCESIYNDMIKK